MKGPYTLSGKSLRWSVPILRTALDSTGIDLDETAKRYRQPPRALGETDHQLRQRLHRWNESRILGEDLVNAIAEACDGEA
jgi:hypothetical protein